MKKIFIPIALSLLTLLISCQSTSSTMNKTLNLNFEEGDLNSLHPHLLSTHLRGTAIGKALFECLTRINAQGDVELAGAISCEISKDLKYYVFKIRDHKWSDGSEVTAFHYENTWKRALSPTSDCPRSDVFYIIKNGQDAKKGLKTPEEIGVKALDKNTLQVELDYASPYFLQLIASPLFAPLKNENEQLPLFNGPFIVSEWEKDRGLSLVHNPLFWDQKKVKLSGIEISMVKDSMTALSMYDKKEIDWLGNPFTFLTPEMCTSISNKNALHKKAVLRPFWVYLNTQNPLLKSANIRKALSAVIDRHLITEHILVNNDPLTHVLPKSHLVQPTLTQNEAIELFEQGLNELNLSREDFSNLSLTYVPSRKQLSEYIQESWTKAFGINIKLEQIEWNAFRNNLEKGNYDMAGCFEAALYSDPIEFLERFEEATAAANFSRWQNSAYKELISLSKRAISLTEREMLFHEAEAILNEETPVIPICNQVMSYTHDKKLKGYVFDHSGCVDFRWAYFE